MDPQEELLVEILRAFARERGIRFPLLSDPDSQTIDAFGLRNQDAQGTRNEGIPHPGTELLDGKGVIRERLFYSGYKARHAADGILAAARRFE